MSAASVTLREGMAFDVAVDGHSFTVDADPAFGGAELGPRPKNLVLAALCGCTAMDVISILRKMRAEPTAFSVHATAESATEHPKVFTRIALTYRFEGEDLPASKLRRAVALSEERYCPVNAMLRPTVDITSRIEVNGELLEG